MTDRFNAVPRTIHAHSTLDRIHDQLPLAVPCYDLVPVTELTVGPDKRVRRVLPAPLT
jgi:hypothetical protein